MRGNQSTTTQEVPQSSFAMTILPGTAPARVRKERAPKDEAPKQPKEPALPKEPRAPRFTLRAHKDAPAVDVAPPVEPAELADAPEPVEAPTPFEAAAPVETAAPVEYAPPANETFNAPPPVPFSPSPAPAQFSPPPAPAPFNAPTPAQFAPPPPPQFAPPAPQFTPTADAFAHLSPPPVHEEPAVAGWYGPVESPAPAALTAPAALNAPAADYPPPAAYPMSPGYPPQPPYAEQSHFGYAPQAAPHGDPHQYAGNPNLSTFAPPPPVGSWVPQHAAPGAGINNGGRSTASKVLIGLAIAVLGFIALSIIAAIVIPVFLSKQKPANRNVVLPAMLLDQQRLSDPDLTSDTNFEITNMQQHIPGGSQTQAAYYGTDGTPTFMVVAGKLARRPTTADVNAFFSSSGTADDPKLTKMGSGQFGGTLECGVATVNGIALTTCASIDSAAAIIVIASNSNPSQLSVITRQVIGAVEQQG